MRWTFIAWPIILLMDIYMIINFITWHEESVYEYDQRQSDIVVNYAIEAATQEMLLNTSDIQLDYVDWGAIQLDPKAGYSAYLALILRSQEWADSEYNRKEFEAEHIPFFLVAGYDGYYLLSKQEYDYTYETGGRTFTNSGYEMVWTPKIPYATTDKNKYNLIASVGDIYNAYYLGDEYYLRVRNDNGKIESDYNSYMSNLALNGVTLEQVVLQKKRLVSDILTQACNDALIDGTFGKANGTFYIPPAYEEWQSTNTIDKPSIITYLSNSNPHNYETYSFAVGGAEITESEYVICYTDKNGQKWYTDVENRSEVLKIIEGTKYESKVKILPSAKAAALEGFFYDMKFF